MKTTKSCENERKTICEERRLVLGRQKNSKKRTKEDRREEGGATPFALIAF